MHLAPTRATALIGAHDCHWHAQLAVLDTLQGVGRPITLLPATQRSTAGLLATDRHGHNGPNTPTRQIAQHLDAAEAFIGIQALDADLCRAYRVEQALEDGDLVEGRLDEHHGQCQPHVVQHQIGSGATGARAWCRI
jgi:hypothetical protein